MLFRSELKHLCRNVFTKATPPCNMRDKPGESFCCCVSCHDITLCSCNTSDRKFYCRFGVLSWKTVCRWLAVNVIRRSVRHNTENYKGKLHVTVRLFNTVSFVRNNSQYPHKKWDKIQNNLYLPVNFFYLFYDNGMNSDYTATNNRKVGNNKLERCRRKRSWPTL
jgi:hypothetical protein